MQNRWSRRFGCENTFKQRFEIEGGATKNPIQARRWRPPRERLQQRGRKKARVCSHTQINEGEPRISSVWVKPDYIWGDESTEENRFRWNSPDPTSMRVQTRPLISTPSSRAEPKRILMLWMDPDRIGSHMILPDKARQDPRTPDHLRESSSDHESLHNEARFITIQRGECLTSS